MIFVTGASGFVGRNLCRTLAGRGIQFVAASRSGTKFIEAKNITFNMENIAQEDLNLAGVDTIIHLAARAHKLADTAANPLAEFRRINRDATMQLAKKAAEYKVKRFVYVSSIGVNGNSTEVGKPFSEKDKPNPHDWYAISKYEAEKALMEFGAGSGMEIVIVRPPLVYGAGAPGNFAKLLKLVEKGLPLPFGAINNLRSFIFVENLVDALILCANHPKAANKIFLVSDGEDLSTPDLVRHIGQMLHKPVRLIFVSLNLLRLPLQLIGKAQIVDKLASSLQIDSSKIREELSWTPPIKLLDGLRGTFGVQN